MFLLIVSLFTFFFDHFSFFAILSTFFIIFAVLNDLHMYQILMWNVVGYEVSYNPFSPFFVAFLTLYEYDTPFAL